MKRTGKTLLLLLIVMGLLCTDLYAVDKDVTTLRTSLENGNIEAAEKFINQASSSTNVRIRKGKALGVAASLGRIDYCKHFLEMGAGIDFFTRENGSSLAQAIRANQFETAKFLVEKGANVSRENREFMPEVARVGMIEFIDLYLSKEGYFDDSMKLSMLHAAIQAGQVPMIEYLLKKKVDVNSIGRHAESPRFAWAFESHKGPLKNREAVIKVLLDNGADLNTVNLAGWTSIAIAVRDKDIKMAERLLAHGAKPLFNIEKAKSMPAEVKEKLEELNANYNLKLSTTQYSQLIQTAEEGGNIAAIIESGNPMDEVKSRRLAYALNAAIRKGNAQATEQLLSLGVDVAAVGYEDFTPLYLAIDCKQPEIIHLLIVHGVDVSDRDHNVLPLTQAVETDSVEVVNAVLTGENNMEQYGNFVLSKAAEQKNVQIVQALLEADANPDSPKSVLYNVMQMPGYKDDPQLQQVASVLREAGADELSPEQRGKQKQEMFGIYVWLIIFIIFGLALGRTGFFAVLASLATLRWEKGEGEITESRVVVQQKVLPRFRLRFFYIPIIKYVYQVNGGEHKGGVLYVGYLKNNMKSWADRAVAKYPKGATVPVYYDPDAPRYVVLEKGKTSPINYPLAISFVLGVASAVALPVLLYLNYF